MIEIILFCEDQFHEKLVGRIIDRVARENSIKLHKRSLSSRGGLPRLRVELEQLIKDLSSVGKFGGKHTLPDGLVVVADANCKGYRGRRKELIEVVNGSITIGDRTVLAIPDPHIERWMMVDQRAFKEVFKRGCDALPRIKCKKNEYKELLLKQIRSADIEPIFGGMEYAEDIANSLDLHHCGDSEPSLGDFLKDLRGLLSKLRDDKRS